MKHLLVLEMINDTIDNRSSNRSNSADCAEGKGIALVTRRRRGVTASMLGRGDRGGEGWRSGGDGGKSNEGGGAHLERL